MKQVKSVKGKNRFLTSFYKCFMFVGAGVMSIRHGSLRRDSVKSLRRKLRLGVMGERRRREEMGGSGGRETSFISVNVTICKGRRSCVAGREKGRWYRGERGTVNIGGKGEDMV